MIITRTSPFTGNTHTMDLDITEEQLTAWRSSKPIQRAMPHLTPDEREFIITGITADEWEKYVGAGE